MKKSSPPASFTGATQTQPTIYSSDDIAPEFFHPLLERKKSRRAISAAELNQFAQDYYERFRRFFVGQPEGSLDLDIDVRMTSRMRQKLGLAYLFITHNIAVVEYLCDRVVVLSHGEIVERGATRSVIETPQHAYTRRLLQAVPRL